ncbi:MAG: ribokinase [Proteiniphilum sp.]
MRKIIVIGSSNTDIMIQTSHLPQPGETVLGYEVQMNQGGKGANQAVAVKRLGGNLVFMTKLGNDYFGEQTLKAFHKEGIKTDYVLVDDHAKTGTAIICVEDSGENAIVVAPGANDLITIQDLEAVLEVMSSEDILLMQLEIPVSTVAFAVQKAFEKGVKVVLNPAPARQIPKSVLRDLYLITPNRIEAELLTGVKINEEQDLATAAQLLSEMGVKNVIITLGDKGCFVKEGERSYRVDAFKKKAVDTTAAGDTFNGALCVALAEGFDLRQAAIFASEASSISVTRIGAQSSIPYRNELAYTR